MRHIRSFASAFFRRTAAEGGLCLSHKGRGDTEHAALALLLVELIRSEERTRDCWSQHLINPGSHYWEAAEPSRRYQREPDVSDTTQPGRRSHVRSSNLGAR